MPWASWELVALAALFNTYLFPISPLSILLNFSYTLCGWSCATFLLIVHIHEQFDLAGEDLTLTDLVQWWLEEPLCRGWVTRGVLIAR